EAGVAPGDYALRLDEIGAGGEVSSRLETPFRREAIAPGAAHAGSMVVQRGDSLWRIAENIYGEGLRYTLIFKANSAAIRDPDLIYPGQIFELPETAGAN
ncbi:MAG: LysM peptidoglycan-binding domain-containing protein, partial [Pikeienuella sp.]